jgi:DNA-directed RNA polymerase subunit RPC12/RpoP
MCNNCNEVIKKVIKIRIPPKERSLATLRSDVATEWHPNKNGKRTPQNITVNSNEKVWWLCPKCGQSYEAIISDRTRKSHGSACPYCAGQRVWRGNCLATLYPDIAKEWHPARNRDLTSYKVTVSSGLSAWWLCPKCGQSYEAIIKQRTKRNGDCPYCDGRRIWTGNCLATLNPKLAKEWDYKRNYKLTPRNVTCGSGKIAHWICKTCGYKWKAQINSRNLRGCPNCYIAKKVMLRNGDACDSLCEAYYYLMLKKRGINFKHHVKIGLGNSSCDFYIPSTNKYVEVTGYNKKWKYWKIYYKKIIRKKNRIVRILKAKFQFVKIVLTPEQIKYVRKSIA